MGDVAHIKGKVMEVMDLFENLYEEHMKKRLRIFQHMRWEAGSGRPDSTDVHEYIQLFVQEQVFYCRIMEGMGVHDSFEREE